MKAEGGSQGVFFLDFATRDAVYRGRASCRDLRLTWLGGNRGIIHGVLGFLPRVEYYGGDDGRDQTQVSCA